MPIILETRLVRDAQLWHAWSARKWEMLGWPVDAFPVTLETVEDLVHPDDRGPFRTALAAHLEMGAPYRLRLRMRRRDGSYGHFNIQGRALRDETGQALRLVGSIADVTARTRLEEALKTLAETAADATGNRFFETLAQCLAHGLSADWAAIGVLDAASPGRIATLAMCMHGQPVANISYERVHTPCDSVAASLPLTIARRLREISQ